jgi:hypothetical protein
VSRDPHPGAARFCAIAARASLPARPGLRLEVAARAGRHFAAFPFHVHALGWLGAS